MSRHRQLDRPKIDPEPIRPGLSIVELVDQTLLAYNGARLREACQLFARAILEPDVVVGLSLAGALIPAGLGMSALIPLVEAGFVDWIVSTGANLHDDTQFGIGASMVRGEEEAGAFYQNLLRAPEFQRSMGTAELHHRVGRHLGERERVLGLDRRSLLAAAHRMDVPIYTPSPGDSSIGMNVAALALAGNRLVIDANADVNETTAIVLEAKRSRRKSAAVLLGGGSPKNFLLQTIPQIQEIFGMEEEGHDYYLQITDARPDTGGLSGATPAEAVSWGKVNAESLPQSVVCYADSTIALPIVCAYALASRKPRAPRRLYREREAATERLRREIATHPWYRRSAPAGGT